MPSLLTYQYKTAPLPPTSGELSPLLVLLHGLGSDERDLMELAPLLPPQFAIASLRAPLSYYEGYAWFSLEITAQGRKLDEEEASASLEKIRATMDSLLQEHSATDIYFMGFSQGAMMSLYLALKYPKYLRGAVLMSGALLPRSWEEKASLADLSDTPFLITHGLQDTVLPISEGRKIYETLQKLPVHITYKTYAMGHEVTRESMIDIYHWLESHQT